MEIKDHTKQRQSKQRHTSFLKRKLRIDLILQEGSFKGGQGNSFSIQDLAMSVKIEKTGAPDFGKANVTIYGLPLDIMEQLSTLSMKPNYYAKNVIRIFAGDEKAGMTQVFCGTITKASADFSGAPEVKFSIESQTAFFGSITAQSDSVINGSQSAASFIEQQVKKAGFSFKNEGVTGQVQNSVYQGSPIEQARQCAREIGAELVLDDDKAVLIGNGASRKGNAPLLKKDTGLIGYPKLTQKGVDVTCIYNPALQFAGAFKLESIVPKASGEWRITKLTHTLEANMTSGGKWESQISASYTNLEGSVGKFQG